MELAALFDATSSPGGATGMTTRPSGTRYEIPDEKLWETRQALRTYLFAFIRERARQRWEEEHVTAARVVAAARSSIRTR